MTIVTNSPLKDLCNKWGGRSEVLPDKLPDMSVPAGSYANLIRDARKKSVMAVTTFSSDEPVDEIIEAASILGTDFDLYFTGNYYNFLKSKGQEYAPPSNVTFTGFISEADYRALMSLVDVVIVLTTKDLILNCGAYEAVSANKPLVLSKTETLMSYFKKGALFVDLNPQEISNGVFQAWKQSEELKIESAKLYRELEGSWEGQFEQVERLVERQ
jgi:glycosyltransferase involved in cell wall biosynthesis